MMFFDVMTPATVWESAAINVFATVLLLSFMGIVISRAIRRAPALRESILRTALLACVCVPLVALALAFRGGSVFTFTLSRSAAVSVADSVPPMPDRPSQPALTERFIDVLIDQMLREPSDASEEVNDTRVVRTPRSAVPAVLESPPIEQVSRSTRFSLSGILLAVWGTGIAALAAITIRGIRLASWIRQQAEQLSEPRVQILAGQAAETMKLRQQPQLLQSSQISAPVVMGYRQPAVILPPWVCGETPDPDLRDILIHEFAHIHRGDTGTIYVQALVRCLFWPIVTIHWLNRELSLAREEICDNFVLAHDDAVSYSELLLRLAKQAAEPIRMSGAIGLLNWRGELERRVVSIFDVRTNRTTTVSPSTRILLAVLFLVAGVALCGTRFASAQQKSEVANEIGNAVALPLGRQRPRPTTDEIGDPLPTGALMRMGTTRFRPPSSVEELAISPDGKTIISIGSVLTAWDTSNGKELWREGTLNFGFEYSGTRYGSNPLAFSSDSSHFYTPGRVDEINVWDTQTGQRRSLTLNSPPQALKDLVGPARSQSHTLAVDVTKDGERFAVASASKLIVCDPTGKTRFEITNTVAQRPFDNDNRDRLSVYGGYCMGRFSPDGNLLAYVGSDQSDKLRLFNVQNGQEVRSIDLKAKLVRFAFSPDGTQIAVTERDNAIRLYEVMSGERIWSKVIELKNPFENYTSAVAFSPDGKTIAAGATDHRIYLIDPATGTEIGTLIGHHWYPWAFAFSVDSRILYSSGWDNLIRRWDIKERKPLPLPQGVHGSEVVAISPTGRFLAYQDDARIIHLIHAETAEDARTFSLPDLTFSRLVFSPDGQQLVAGGSDRDDVHVAIWNIESGETVHHWHWPKGRDPHSDIEDLRFTADGTLLAAAVFRQSAAYVWELRSGDQLVKLKHPEVHGLSFSPDGSTLATAGWDSKVQFWDVATWASSEEMKFPNAQDDPDVGLRDPRMFTVEFSPDGQLFATAHLDGTVCVSQTDNRSLRVRSKASGHFAYACFNFSPDGLWYATGTTNGTIQLWDTMTGKPVGVSYKHEHILYSVEFGSDGRTLVSGGDDRVCYLWDLRPTDLQPFDNADESWTALAGDDSEAAYRASRTLSESADRAVPLLAEKLRAAKSVIDVQRIDENRSAEENQTRQQMKKRLVEKDPQIESTVTVRRAIAVLAQIGTPAAKSVLKELAEQRENGPMSEYAGNALARLKLREAK